MLRQAKAHCVQHTVVQVQKAWVSVVTEPLWGKKQLSTHYNGEVGA
jgi:hypothetical protein